MRLFYNLVLCLPSSLVLISFRRIRLILCPLISAILIPIILHWHSTSEHRTDVIPNFCFFGKLKLIWEDWHESRGSGGSLLATQKTGETCLSQCTHTGVSAQYSLAAKHFCSVLTSKSILLEVTSFKGGGSGTRKIRRAVSTQMTELSNCC